MPKKKKIDPISNSRPYQALARKEREGAFAKTNPWDGGRLDKAIDNFIQPKVDWIKSKLKKKRLDQAGQGGK